MRELNDIEFGTHVKFSTMIYMDATYTLQSCGFLGLSEPSECTWERVLRSDDLHESGFQWVLDLFKGRPALGFLTVESPRERNEVHIDGAFEGYTLLRLVLTPGRHTYSLKNTASKKITCKGEVRIEPKKEHRRGCPIEE
jgi:hypothetical protein